MSVFYYTYNVDKKFSNYVLIFVLFVKMNVCTYFIQFLAILAA